MRGPLWVANLVFGLASGTCFGFVTVLQGRRWDVKEGAGKCIFVAFRACWKTGPSR